MNLKITLEFPLVSLARKGLSVCALAIFCFAAGCFVEKSSVVHPAFAATYQMTSPARSYAIRVPVHRSRVISFDQALGDVVVGDTNIVDVMPLSGREAYIQTKRVGSTNILVSSSDSSRRAVLEIEVTPDIDGMKRAIHSIGNNSGVSIKTVNGRIVITGTVDSVATSERIMELAATFVDDRRLIINALVVANSSQVLLEVRFLEVNRSIGKDVGVSLNARRNDIGRTFGGTGVSRPMDTTSTSAPVINAPIIDAFNSAALGASPYAVGLINMLMGATSIDVAIRALEEKGVTRRLAEPNLVSLSGQKASFLAGGEYPYKTTDPRTGAQSTSFKDFGVKLTFLPTVLRGGVINIQINPEFSQLDFSSGGNEPALKTRSAQTVVELRDGQTFVVAGLLDGLNRREVVQLPWVGNIPVLGTLFRSASFQKDETELMILVTPRLVSPLSPKSQIASPLDQKRSSNEPELFLNGSLERDARTIGGRGSDRRSGNSVGGHIIDVNEWPHEKR